jgi:hypothetical protein
MRPSSGLPATFSPREKEQYGTISFPTDDHIDSTHIRDARIDTPAAAACLFAAFPVAIVTPVTITWSAVQKQARKPR